MRWEDDAREELNVDSTEIGIDITDITGSRIEIDDLNDNLEIQEDFGRNEWLEIVDDDLTEISIEDEPEADKYLEQISDEEIIEAYNEHLLGQNDFEFKASEFSHSSIDRHYNRLTDEPIVIDMPFDGDKYDVNEVIEQGYLQEDGLNDLTVAQYLKNYESRRENGRSKEGTESQREYRHIAVETTADELMTLNEGLAYERAREIAVRIYEKGAVLHNPDQIAGGEATEVHMISSKRVNSLFGGLWGSGKAKELYEQIAELSKELTEEEKQNTRLHVRLNIYKK